MKDNITRKEFILYITIILFLFSILTSYLVEKSVRTAVNELDSVHLEIDAADIIVYDHSDPYKKAGRTKRNQDREINNPQ